MGPSSQMQRRCAKELSGEFSELSKKLASLAEEKTSLIALLRMPNGVSLRTFLIRPYTGSLLREGHEGCNHSSRSGLSFFQSPSSEAESVR